MHKAKGYISHKTNKKTRKQKKKRRKRVDALMMKKMMERTKCAAEKCTAF